MYIAIIILVFIVALALAYKLLRPMLSAAPFMLTNKQGVEDMFTLAAITPGEVVVDLGSGDGELVLEAGKRGARVTGYEIDSQLVKKSRERIAQERLTGVEVREQSFWNADLSDVDVVLIFLLPHALRRLEKKLKAELKPGARVVSFAFEFKHWEKEGTQGNAYLYIKS